MRSPFRRKNANLRLAPIYVAAVAAAVFADPTPPGVGVGLALIAVGLALRAWGAGHLVKTDRLTVSGPYAHLRHPLYLGSLLLAAGILCFAGGAVAGPGLLCLVPAFFFYYLPYKDRIESARLERRFGAAFGAYKAAVGALRPRLRPWRGPDALALEGARRWSAERFRDNSEPGTLVFAALVVALLALRPVLAG